MSDRSQAGGGIEGVLLGLGDLVEKLGQLAETGEQLKRSGQFDSGQDMKAVYGFSVRFGAGGDGATASEPKVEPFGNVRRDEHTGVSVVQEVIEPMIDVFDEQDHIKVVAELPGISDADVKLDLQEDILLLQAEHGEKKYRKEILLPRVCDPNKLAYSCRNGILEVRLT
ncbi:Hsp20/alpha crystallin family protein [Lamprobacter modestohalophilus]|uniref:Hsp20/alpha crystallin family protein n=1 Tax=Lamprobacter modestohalophilus TaxID=1064514 RepID=UPI002ADEBCB1|nr:Hsp20/alpha crystallin family protein [Lamprobacter modestohalophilus]MEA1050650.1 Hsp20/alpha crystallin family protein [Lamprobacter modestohalophilus]